jgi:hypothetical protein
MHTGCLNKMYTLFGGELFRNKNTNVHNYCLISQIYHSG